MTSQRKVIFVVGTTASGKSDWALRLAQQSGGVIVNCDSVQVYQKLDIGSAKPSIEERSLVPHYLFDYVAPPHEITAGIYEQDFWKVLEGIPEENPIYVVGGTGFYFMALEKGMYPVTEIPKDIRDSVSEQMRTPEGVKSAFAEVRTIDPEYADKLHAADHYRIGRALELIRTEKKAVTQIQADFADLQRPFPHQLLKIGPAWERDELGKRIWERTLKMVELGLYKEVEGLVADGLESWAPMMSVGYKETLLFLKGAIQNEQSWIQQVAINTRQLAKKQRTWFQRDQGIEWFAGNGKFEDVQLRVESFLKA